MELSSYQLEAAPRISPRIGIWTNLTPDHLDRHKSFENYKYIKHKIFENSEKQILNRSDKNIYKTEKNIIYNFISIFFFILCFIIFKFQIALIIH